MNNGPSPIIETSNSSSSTFTIISILLFALAGGLFYLIQNKKKAVTNETIVVVEEADSPSYIDESTVNFGDIEFASISPVRMQTFYIGVSNPLKIRVPGISPSQYKVGIKGGGAIISKRDNQFLYEVKATKPTNDCVVNVSIGDFSYDERFQVKRLPTPTARLGNKVDGSIGSGEFKAQRGVIAWLDNFDFDAKCNIQGFMMTKISNKNEVTEVINRGGRFTEENQLLVRSAKPGDTFIMSNVKAKCPGDAAGRKINSLVFKIK